ncbi:MAG: sodium:proton antiporter [Archangium sp.]
MPLSLFVILSVLLIVGVYTFAPKLSVSAPLLLVAAGVAISLARVGPEIHLEPEWILAGVLPMLLYAASISMPAMDFRRDFRAISGLSVTLVVWSALALGWFFSSMIPDLGFAGGVALGAIVSPTDAVATGIVKQLRVAPRAVAVLDGESLLNDASALVLLRSAIAAIATAVSLWGVAWSFLLSVVIATAIGVGVGYVALRLRQRMPNPTANTLLSFVIPYVAYVPAEHLGASGLVAVVAVGITMGHASPRFLPPTLRHNDEQNWRTVELLLEGALFFLMGLQLVPLLDRVDAGTLGFARAAMLAGLALGIMLLVRAIWVALMLQSQRKVRAKWEAALPRFTAMKNELATAEDSKQTRAGRTRTQRALSDIAFMMQQPLGGKHGVLLVWAGMRGAVTVAAAQTLPNDMPHRSFLVLTAFLVATFSLVVQGSTLPWLVKKLGFPPPDPELERLETESIRVALEQAAASLLDTADLKRADGAVFDSELVARVRKFTFAGANEEQGEQQKAAFELVKQVLDAQRTQLLQIRTEGTCSSEGLKSALAKIDAIELSLFQRNHHQQH